MMAAGQKAKGKRSLILRLWCLAAGLLAVFLLSFVLGRYDVPIHQVLRILLNEIQLIVQSS